MLNDVFTPKFYTHKFLIITDILDSFANLVYNRIYQLAFDKDKTLSFNEINSSLVKSLAKDICCNWMMKCSCIRELLPRIYIDITFLKIFKFIMNDKEIETRLNTIAKMIKGISHPLISFYVCMYLAKIGVFLYPKFKNYLITLVEILSKFTLSDEILKKYSKYNNFKIRL